MTARKTLIAPALLALWLAASPLMATTWVEDFTSTPPEIFEGDDATTVTTYADPSNPPDGTKDFHLHQPFTFTTLPPGWLTQGLREDVPTTLKFSTPAGDGLSGRGRMVTILPTTMAADHGVSFAWTARYGNYNIGRGPIQLAVTRDGGPGTQGAATGEYSIYVRVRGGNQVSILNNAGNGHSNISTLTLANNVADGLFHQWSCSVISLSSDNLAHWKLWVDGQQLLFAGTNGAHQLDPTGGSDLQQFSFKTGYSDGFSDDLTPYISLGELSTSDRWDFEFDCVAYTDEGMLDNFTCGQALAQCASAVNPAGNQAAAAFRGSAPSTTNFAYTFWNAGLSTINFTAAETDADGNPQDYPWLQLDKTGGTLTSNTTDVVTASITDTTLSHGTYTAYLTFTDDCPENTRHTRRIDLTITDCAATIYPPGEVARSIWVGGADPLAEAVFAVTNTGTDGLNYQIAEDPDCTWLTLDTSTTGALTNGQTAVVHAALDPTGLPVGTHTCTLRFTNTRPDCTNPLADQFRTVTIHVVDVGLAYEQFNAEFTDVTGSDLTTTSPVASCDSLNAATREFMVSQDSAVVGNLTPGWLSQGTIDGVPTTLRFHDPADGKTGRARVIAPLGFDARYDPLKGMVAAWRMKVGNYSIGRGPIEIVFPSAPGPLPTEVATTTTYTTAHAAYVLIRNGVNVTILNNDGNRVAGINALVLPISIANEYHQWTASVSAGPHDSFAYWNLWLDGNQLLFTGSNADGTAGSPVGPDGKVWSFRTIENTGDRDPFITFGDVTLTYPDVLDIEVDWLRFASWSPAGGGFWDGEGCLAALCNQPFADVDGDQDVDQADFAVFQACFTGDTPATVFADQRCRCLDLDANTAIDGAELQMFLNCFSGPSVPWVASPECP